ncbi:phage major capsid protein [Methylobacterium sp. Leaf94]|uniref:phage major capsid protein n=1 Tax=Methylobacterium sp. Leaf94 TaxID=1736250 RepID=UPI000AD0A762|nr:phage major capsid protein [Methylobacterium sp. Leaf94]
MTHASLNGTAGHYPRAMLGSVMASVPLPRALLSTRPDGLPGLRADLDPKEVLRQIAADFDAFKTRHRGEMDGVQSAYDDMQKRLAALGIAPSGDSSALPVDPEYTRTFANWMRRDDGEQELKRANASGERAIIRAAMNSGSNQDGGYIAPVEWDRQIHKALRLESSLRNLCTVVSTASGGYSTLWNTGGWGSGWVGETATRPQTSTATLAPITFKAGELYAQPAITQNLLEDAGINLEDWLAAEVADEFNKQEGIAFISGDGVNKPQGFLSYIGTGTNIHPGGEPGVTNTGAAAAITGDGLIALVYALGARYRANGSWLMNSATMGAVSKLKDGQGNYLWQPSLILGQPPTLVGKPVYFDESMPDVAAGALPVAFGDWSRFYVINDRVGTSLLRDPYTAKPFVLFYTRKRVGGGILDPRAVRFLKVAA